MDALKKAHWMVKINAIIKMIIMRLEGIFSKLHHKALPFRAG